MSLLKYEVSVLAIAAATSTFIHQMRASMSAHLKPLIQIGNFRTFCPCYGTGNSVSLTGLGLRRRLPEDEDWLEAPAALCSDVAELDLELSPPDRSSAVSSLSPKN